MQFWVISVGYGTSRQSDSYQCERKKKKEKELERDILAILGICSHYSENCTYRQSWQSTVDVDNDDKKAKQNQS